MTNLLSVAFTNFQSYGSTLTTIDLTSPGTTMISGQNLDDGGTSNGAGKTSIINAISYGLYDNPVSDISKDGLINNINGKNMEVFVEFEIGGLKYNVHRYRKLKGKGNGVQITRSGEDITPDSISNTNKLIVDILKMPHDTFVRVVVFSAINTQFLNLPSRNQSDMLEELLDLTMLTDKAKELKLNIQDTNRSLEIETNNIQQTNNDIQRFLTQLKSVHESAQVWIVNNKSKITTLTQDVKDLDSINISEQRALTQATVELTNEILSLQREEQATINKQKQNKDTLDKLNLSKLHEVEWESANTKTIDDTTSDLETLLEVDTDKQLQLFEAYIAAGDIVSAITNTLKQLNLDVKDLEAVIAEKTNELNQLKENICPYCSQTFKNTQLKMSSCEDMIAEATATLKLTTKQINDASTKQLEHKTIYEELAPKITHTDDAIATIITQIRVDREKLNQLESAINPYSAHVLSLTDEYDPEDEHKLETQLKNQVIQVDLLVVEIDATTQKITISADEMDAYDANYATKTSQLKSAETDTNDMLHHSNDMLDGQSPMPSLSYKQLLSAHDIDTSDLTKMFDTITMTNDVIQYTDHSDELHNKLKHQQFLLKLLTNKNSFIRKTMLNKSIPFLNKQLNTYLNEMGMPHSIVFTPKMEVAISRMGKHLQYGNLSNGQQCRVNLALSFAFRDVLQYLHDPINVWMLDEVLDVGLDNTGIQQAAGMIKNKAKQDKSTIFVISHRDEISNTFDNNIVVQLKDGFSTIR